MAYGAVHGKAWRYPWQLVLCTAQVLTDVMRGLCICVGRGEEVQVSGGAAAGSARAPGHSSRTDRLNVCIATPHNTNKQIYGLIWFILHPHFDAAGYKGAHRTQHAFMHACRLSIHSPPPPAHLSQHCTDNISPQHSSTTNPPIDFD